MLLRSCFQDQTLPTSLPCCQDLHFDCSQLSLFQKCLQLKGVSNPKLWLLPRVSQYVMTSIVCGEATKASLLTSLKDNSEGHSSSRGFPKEDWYHHSTCSSAPCCALHLSQSLVRRSPPTELPPQILFPAEYDLQ